MTMTETALLSMVERFLFDALDGERAAAELGAAVRRINDGLLEVESTSPPVARARLEELNGEVVGIVLWFAPPMTITVDAWCARFGPATREPPRPEVFHEIDRRFSIERDANKGFIVATTPRMVDGTSWPVTQLVVRRRRGL